MVDWKWSTCRGDPLELSDTLIGRESSDEYECAVAAMSTAKAWGLVLLVSVVLDVTLRSAAASGEQQLQTP